MVMKELLKSIAALSSLSDNTLCMSTRLIILCDLAAAMSLVLYRPEEICCFLKNEETLYAVDKAVSDFTPTALVVQSSNCRNDLTCNGCKL